VPSSDEGTLAPPGEYTAEGGRSPTLSFVSSHPEECTSERDIHRGWIKGINE